MSRRAELRRAAVRGRRLVLAWTGAGVAFAAVLVLVAVAISGAAGGGDGPATRLGDGTRVSMTDFAFSPDPIVLSGADRVLTIVNDGAVAHDLVIPELGKGTPDLLPGEELALDLGDQPSGTYDVVCDLPGHVAAGMVTRLEIE